MVVISPPMLACLFNTETLMIDIAIYNSHEEHQFHHDAGPLVLAEVLPECGEEDCWNIVQEVGENDCQQHVEICQHSGRVAIQIHSANQQSILKFELALPAEFHIGDTRFEIVDASRTTDTLLQPAANTATNHAVAEPSERNVSILFADLRNFSSICEALETADSYQLLNEIMDCLTAAVIDHGGMVIDYYGDGLSAMWNAPRARENHPLLACWAALQMLEELPSVNTKWRQRLPRDLRIGIGVHTGPAQVGNIGSQRCIKYGPRGTTVNLTSRVEAATKKIRVPLLVTSAVATQLSRQPLPPEMIVYRTCQAQLRGIPESVDLFAVARPSTVQRTLADLDRYEQALKLFEAGQLEAADRLLQNTTGDHGTPVRFLAEHVHAVQCQQLGRRASDDAENEPSPAIPLDVK